MSENNTLFRGTYIVLPAAFFLLSLVLAALFYGKLPAEVAYHFTGGVPDRWLGRGAIIAWMLVPQCFLFLCAIIITSLAARLGRRLSLEESALTGKVLLVMGNMVALPQAILFFAMLHIILYNAYQVHLMPLWVWVIIVMVLGGVILGIFLGRVLGQYRRPSGKTLKE